MKGFFNALFRPTTNTHSLAKTLMFLSSVGASLAETNSTNLARGHATKLTNFDAIALSLGGAVFLLCACYACCKCIKGEHVDYHHIDTHHDNHHHHHRYGAFKV